MAASEELLTVAAVARRIGVAPATLRTWDRRYGLGPSSHESGDHRRYCPEDLAKLMMMRRLISSGVPAGEAAEKAKSHKGRVTISSLTASIEIDEELVGIVFKAAASLDREYVEGAFSKAIQKDGIIKAWHELIVPVLKRVGSTWEEKGNGIEVEHLLTETTLSILRDFTPEIKKPKNANPVLIASVGEELHSIPLYALRAALAEHSVDSRILGARTPVEALSVVMKKSAPPAIFLWAQLDQNADERFINDLPTIRPAPRVVLGGPGWECVDCSSVAVVKSLSAACEEILAAVGHTAKGT